MSTKIKQLPELLEQQLENDEKIVSCTESQLTAPGENYGSSIKSLAITIRNERTRQERPLDAVVKLVPQDEQIQEVFNTKVSFKNEISFYTKIVPTLNYFIAKKGILDKIDFVAKFYGSRLSLNPHSDKVDQDAALVLENLKTTGYKTGSKLEGLDLESSKLVLGALAKLHATSIALKFDKADIFEQIIKPYVWDFDEDPTYLLMIRVEMEKVLKSHGFPPDIVEICSNTIKRRSETRSREPWSTLIHYDCWVNNLMIKYDENNHPTNCKLVDYQLCAYKPPTRDVVFFVFSSVRDDVLRQNIDNLLTFYYETFIGYLKQLDVDIEQFSRESFDEELKIAAQESEYYHVILMLPPLLEKEFVDFSFFTNYKPSDAETIWNEKHRKKLVFVTREFQKRNWLK